MYISARCGECHGEIGYKSVLVGSQRYHEDCFVCSMCQARLEEGYFVLEGRNCCLQCRCLDLRRSMSSVQPVCRDKAVPRCDKCGLALNGQYFYADQDTGKELCTTCHEVSP